MLRLGIILLAVAIAFIVFFPDHDLLPWRSSKENVPEARSEVDPRTPGAPGSDVLDEEEAARLAAARRAHYQPEYERVRGLYHLRGGVPVRATGGRGEPMTLEVFMDLRDQGYDFVELRMHDGRTDRESRERPSLRSGDGGLRNNQPEGLRRESGF